MMPKSPKLASFPRVARPARARSMTQRIGGRILDLYLSAQLEIRSGLLVGREIWGCQLTTRGGEVRVPKGVIVAAQNEPKSGVPPMVYLQAGLEIGSAVPYAIHRESNGDSNASGSQRSPCHSAW